MQNNFRRTIIFTLPSLSGGGAERAAVDVINHLSSERYRKILVLFSAEGVYNRNIFSDVKILTLSANTRFVRFFQLRKVIQFEKPDIVVSFLSHVVTAAIRLVERSFFFILDEQNPPLAFLADNNFFGSNRLKRLFIRVTIHLCYGAADRIVVISKGIGDEIKDNFDVPASKITHIPNPVDLDRIGQGPGREFGCRTEQTAAHLIAVGRLALQKDYPTLFKAVKLVKERHGREIFLNVLGVGPEQKNLEHLAEALSLNKVITFSGFKNNPWEYMRQADIFVLSSVYEGFGNVIIEAMACGVPVISTECCYGPKEIITGNVNGLLVPISNPEALAEAIMSLLSDDTLRARLAISGLRTVRKYSAENICTHFEQMFDSLRTV